MDREGGSPPQGDLDFRLATKNAVLSHQITCDSEIQVALSCVLSDGGSEGVKQGEVVQTHPY